MSIIIGTTGAIQLSKFVDLHIVYLLIGVISILSSMVLVFGLKDVKHAKSASEIEFGKGPLLYRLRATLRQLWTLISSDPHFMVAILANIANKSSSISMY